MNQDPEWSPCPIPGITTERSQLAEGDACSPGEDRVVSLAGGSASRRQVWRAEGQNQNLASWTLSCSVSFSSRSKGSSSSSQGWERCRSTKSFSLWSLHYVRSLSFSGSLFLKMWSPRPATAAGAGSWEEMPNVSHLDLLSHRVPLSQDG